MSGSNSAERKRHEPLVLVETADLSEEDWLDYRRRGIGGSDVSAIFGTSPFRTARDLYYDKLNIASVEDDEGNWVAMEMGHLLEPLVAKIFERKTGYRVYQIKKMFQHPQYPWMLADVDYFVELSDGTTAILEIKTTNYNARDNWWMNTEIIFHAEPVVDIVMQCLPKIRKLPEIIASIDRIPKLIQIIVEHTTQYLAGSVADHRDVHRNQIPFKGGIPALLDSVPKALPGLFTKPIHADDFSPVAVQTVNVQIAPLRMLMQVIRMEAYRSRKEISITMPTTKKQAKKVISPRSFRSGCFSRRNMRFIGHLTSSSAH